MVTDVAAEVFEQRWEQMTSWDLITPNYSTNQYNLESTISLCAKQNYKHLNLFLTGTQKLQQLFCTENTCEFPSEHPSLWKQLSSTASRTPSISVLHLIPQPVGQQQQAGGQAVFVVLCRWENLEWVSGVLSPLLLPPKGHQAACFSFLPGGTCWWYLWNE